MAEGLTAIKRVQVVAHQDLRYIYLHSTPHLFPHHNHA